MKEKLKKQDVGFAQVKNDVLGDPSLSWKAKGIYAYLYGNPMTGIFRCTEFIKTRKEEKG